MNLKEKLQDFKAEPAEYRWKFYTRAALGLALVLLIYGLYASRTAKVAATSNVTLAAQFDSVGKKYKELYNHDSFIVADNIGLKAQAGDVKTLSDQVFKMQGKQESLIRTVTTLTQIKQQVRRDSVFVPFDTSHPIALVAPGRSDSIAVPQPFSKPDTNGGIYGHVTKGGVEIDSNIVLNTLSLRHGTKKAGFLGLGSEDFVEALNSNKNVRTVGLASVSYHPSTGAWNKWVKPLLAAVLATFGTIYIHQKLQ